MSGRKRDTTHLALGDLERALVLANLEQLHNALLVGCQPSHLPHDVTHKLHALGRFLWARMAVQPSCPYACHVCHQLPPMHSTLTKQGSDVRRGHPRWQAATVAGCHHHHVVAMLRCTRVRCFPHKQCHGMVHVLQHMSIRLARHSLRRTPLPCTGRVFFSSFFTG